MNNSNINNKNKRKLNDITTTEDITDSNFQSEQSQSYEDDNIDTKSRLNYLWNLSHYAQPFNSQLGRFYMYQFRDISNINEMIGMPPFVETRNCSNCGCFLVPGYNCRVRISSQSELSHKLKSKISSSTVEINSLEKRNYQKYQEKLQNKPTNAIVQTCLECSRLNAIKADNLDSKKRRKASLKLFKKQKLINEQEQKQEQEQEQEQQQEKVKIENSNNSMSTSTSVNSNSNSKINDNKDKPKQNQSKKPAPSQPNAPKAKGKISQPGSSMLGKRNNNDNLKGFLEDIGGFGNMFK